MRPLLTARELAEILGLQPGTVLDKFERGELPGFKLGRSVRFSTDQIEDYLEQNRRGSEVAPRRPSAGRLVRANHPRPIGGSVVGASEPKEEAPS